MPLRSRAPTWLAGRPERHLGGQAVTRTAERGGGGGGEFCELVMGAWGVPSAEVPTAAAVRPYPGTYPVTGDRAVSRVYSSYSVYIGAGGAALGTTLKSFHPLSNRESQYICVYLYINTVL